jgi:hypothetical protein
MRRLAALLACTAALAASACGGSSPSGDGARSQPAVTAATEETAVAGEPTPEQLAARRELLRQIAEGTYHCNCTSAERARDRVARGLVKTASAAQPVPTP